LRPFKYRRGALQFVPPQGNDANRWALVMTESRGFRFTQATSDSNGITSACGFFRSTAAATNAAMSMQRTAVVDPLRDPVAGVRIEPEMSGHTYTLPSIRGTFFVAISIAS
jgi:hypothetical protein